MRKNMSPGFQMPLLRLWSALIAASVLSACMGVDAADFDTRTQALEAALKAGILTEAEYKRKKAAMTASAEPAGGDARTGSVQPQKQEKLTTEELAPAKTDGKIYRHPTGVSFWYPVDWRLVELDGIVQLLPPGAASSPESFESYFITGERVAEEGITRANDPLVIEYLEEQMAMLGAQLGVAFQRLGGPKAITTSMGEGEGIRLDWTARSAIGPADAYAMASIIGDYGLVVSGVGIKGLAKKREPTVLRIFTSFGVERGKNDPALVGTWHLKSTYAVQNDSVWETARSKAKLASETKSTLHLNLDGTWTRQDQFYMIVGAGNVWRENHDVTASEGRWNADGGRLFMLWKDHSFADYQYQLEGGQLHLLADGKGQAWGRGQ